MAAGVKHLVTEFFLSKTVQPFVGNDRVLPTFSLAVQFGYERQTVPDYLEDFDDDFDDEFDDDFFDDEDEDKEDKEGQPAKDWKDDVEKEDLAASEE